MKVTILSVQKIKNPDDTTSKLCRCRIVYNDGVDVTEETRDILLTPADLVDGSSKKAAIRAKLSDLAVKEGLEAATKPDSMVGNEYTYDA